MTDESSNDESFLHPSSEGSLILMDLSSEGGSENSEIVR